MQKRQSQEWNHLKAVIIFRIITILPPQHQRPKRTPTRLKRFGSTMFKCLKDTIRG